MWFLFFLAQMKKKFILNKNKNNKWRTPKLLLDSKWV
jgi:hypothetical protein